MPHFDIQGLGISLEGYESGFSIKILINTVWEKITSHYTFFLPPPPPFTTHAIPLSLYPCLIPLLRKTYHC